MAKGFVIAITITIILIVMLLYTQNFAAKQNSDLQTIADLLASEKVAHAWSDVQDDIRKAANIRIEKINNTVSFYDQLPAKNRVYDYLHYYGIFIQTFYETPDIDIIFLTPGGQLMDLGDIPAVITILPQNIQYYYPSSANYDAWAKRELVINSSAENFSAIKDLIVHLNFSNVYLDCTPANPAGLKACEGPGTLQPLSTCGPSPTYPLYLNFSLSDYLGQSYNFSRRCLDIAKKTTWNIPMAHPSGSSDFWVTVTWGALPYTVMNVELHNVEVNITTQLILNTSDFYISYLANLGVEAVNYNTSKIDRI